MKVAFKENNVLGSAGLQQTGGFTIAASAHAFKMLSSGLYSDKVRAVLREIGCNAMDAHIVAGTPDRPFRVKLPNTLDDQFYVMDWGPGLSHDEVMGLYTTYFQSTKQSSNDVTGAFGLGSKSPFSYTDSFSVVSTHGDKKRTYSLYIGNTGAPQVSLMAEEEPDAGWKHGVKVGFAVKPEHYEEFITKAQTVYQWFRVPPEMRGCEPIKPVDYKFECEDFRLVEGAQTRGAITAIMGNVAYPIDSKELGLKSIDHKTEAGKIINYATVVPGLVMLLPIGSVQVAANREALQYDPASVAVLKDALDLIMRRIGKDVVTSLQDAAKGGWKELCQVDDKVKTMWGGSGISWHFDAFAAAMGVSAAAIPILEKFVGKSTVTIPPRTNTNVHSYVVYKSHWGKGGAVPYMRDTYQGRDLRINPNTVIAAGTAKKAASRARRAVNEGKYEQVLVFTGHKDVPVSQSDVVAEARLASDLLGQMEVIDIAALPPYDPPLIAGVRKKKSKKWVPTLPTGVSFSCLQGAQDITLELHAVEPLYMCTYETNKWGNTTRFVRLLEGKMDKDKRLSLDDWRRIWNAYAQLQDSVKLKFGPTSCALLTAAQIKGIALPQLGWRPAYRVVEDYMKQPDLQTELRKKLKKRHLAAPNNPYEVKGWMTGLAWYMGSVPVAKCDTEVVRLLTESKLYDQLRDMINARGKKVLNVPEIDWYQYLCQQFGLKNDLATDIQAALTVEDADAAFVAKYPRAEVIDPKAVIQSQALMADTLQFILSKEA